MSDQELLKWYKEMGVDEAIADQPVNRFALSIQEVDVTPEQPSGSSQLMEKGKVQPFSSQPISIQRSVSPLSTDIAKAKQTAQEISNTATDLDTLKSGMEGFEGCSLKFTATQMVFGAGAAHPQSSVHWRSPRRRRRSSRHSLYRAQWTAFG